MADEARIDESDAAAPAPSIDTARPHQLWLAELSSFAGFVAVAEHYYVKLRGTHRYELLWRLDEAGARAMNVSDRTGSYKPGDTSRRFPGKNEAAAAVIAAFEALSAPGDFLMRGVFEGANVGIPLAPVDHPAFADVAALARTNAVLARRWDVDRKAARDGLDALYSAWASLRAAHGLALVEDDEESADIEIVVERVDGAWQVGER